jgi:hypothetical protein
MSHNQLVGCLQKKITCYKDWHGEKSDVQREIGECDKRMVFHPLASEGDQPTDNGAEGPFPIPIVIKDWVQGATRTVKIDESYDQNEADNKECYPMYQYERASQHFIHVLPP